MNHRMTIAQICGAVESPLFDRKSARIDAKTLAIHLIAFANADGGMIAVGVEDDGADGLGADVGVDGCEVEDGGSAFGGLGDGEDVDVSTDELEVVVDDEGIMTEVIESE